ncbi:hypothetical protein LIER_24884 [Lithospermum erythrorhizon]|uniref:RNase H type-1 domain-containing protein n=1 Tax=Lithospermum erythrorhizon TaxID=34254 RepID=A0AAV3R2S9_LITER
MEYALRFSFKAINNEAEYKAMIAGLMLVKSLGIQRVIVRGDSKLIMDQINGECGVKNKTLAKYHEKAVTMAKGFDQTIFQHVPRAQIEEEDRFVLEEPDDWRTPIARYLTTGQFPGYKLEAKKTQNVSYKFHMYQGELYKKSVEGLLLLYVSAGNISKVLFEVHNGWCGSHIGGRSLTLKITRIGFF